MDFQVLILVLFPVKVFANLPPQLADSLQLAVVSKAKHTGTSVSESSRYPYRKSKEKSEDTKSSLGTHSNFNLSWLKGNLALSTKQAKTMHRAENDRLIVLVR